MSLIKKNGQTRWSPSYLRNRGHMSKGQKKVMRSLWPTYGITLHHGSLISLPSSWDTDKPIIIEIGFGQGEHILKRSSQEPNSLFLGVEVHKPAIANVLKQIQTNNIRLVRVDALVLLCDYLPPSSAAEICIFFPEPWSNHNQHRRIIRPETLPMIEYALKEGGSLYFATDIEDYAQCVLDMLKHASHWSSSYDSFAPRPPWRPLSKYEKKGIQEERPIFDLHWRYTPT